MISTTLNIKISKFEIYSITNREASHSQSSSAFIEKPFSCHKVQNCYIQAPEPTLMMSEIHFLLFPLIGRTEIRTFCQKLVKIGVQDSLSEIHFWPLAIYCWLRNSAETVRERSLSFFRTTLNTQFQTFPIDWCQKSITIQ